MNTLVLDHLLWSVCGPYNKPLTFQEIQTMTGLDSPAIADALRSPDVRTIWAGDRLAYRPSEEALRRTVYELSRPFTAMEEAPSNVIPLRIGA